MPVVEGLRRRGWSVTTAMDEGTLGDADADQLDYAASNGWPLLTFDDDFLSMVESDEFEGDHAGIVFVSQHGRDVGELVGRIDAALQHNADRELTNEVVFAQTPPDPNGTGRRSENPERHVYPSPLVSPSRPGSDGVSAAEDSIRRSRSASTAAISSGCSW